MLFPGIIFMGISVVIFMFFREILAQLSSSSFWACLPFLLFPAAFGAAGLGMTFGPPIAGWRRKRLLATGDHLIATITEVAQDPRTRVSANGIAQWRFYATAMDPVTGEMRMFQSKFYSYDPTPLLIREEVDVYVHPTNRKRYIMDETSAMR